MAHCPKPIPDSKLADCQPMKRIDFFKLRKGDILLTTSVGKKSGVIRAVTRSDISHAMLYVAHGSVMDSTGDGVHARNLQRQIYDDDCAIYAYRTKDAIDSETMDNIIAYVRSETGAPYATFEAMKSPLKWGVKGGKAQFCSRLVARAYANAGYPLTDNPDFTTPADLQKSPRLQSIPDVVLHVTAQEKKGLFGIRCGIGTHDQLPAEVAVMEFGVETGVSQ